MAGSTRIAPLNHLKLVLLSPFTAATAFLVVSGLNLNTKFDPIDDSLYIVLARSLAGGFGFSDIHLPEPGFHQHFPPGLPLLLALPSWFGFDLSTSVILYKLLLIGCGALGLYLFAHFAAGEGNSRESIAAAVLIASISITLVSYSVRVASEFLYVPLSVGALMSLVKYERSSRRSRWLWISAFLLVATILTRSIGVTLFIATILSWSLRRDFKRIALLIACTGLFWLPWLAASKAASTGVASYSQEFLSFYRSDALLSIISRVLENSWFIVNRDIPRMILSFSASELIQSKLWLDMMLMPVRLSISALVVFGIIRGLWPRPRIAPLYLVCYFLPVLAWRWDPARYIVPVVPFICLWFVVGLESLAGRFNQDKASLLEWRPRLVTVVAIACLASNLISDARFILTTRRTGHYTSEAAAQWNERLTAYDWIKQHTHPASIIGCEPPIHPNVYLFTQRKAVPLRSRPQVYRKLGITHIIHITDPTMYQGREVNRKPDLQQFLQGASGKVSFTPVYQSAHIAIFEIN